MLHSVTRSNNHRRKNSRSYLMLACAVLCMIGAQPVFAGDEPDEAIKSPPVSFQQIQSAEDGWVDENDLGIDSKPPPSLEELQGLEPDTVVKEDLDTSGLPVNIRRNAVSEAALSYGARGGLAWRTYYIRREIEHRKSYMDKVFDFRNLLISAPSGLLIEPPVISEQDNALLIQTGGDKAAVADRIYEINKNAQIVSTPRHWRNYLEREWGEVLPPPDILRPHDKKERAVWMEAVAKGWRKGVEQADEIFDDDLNQLTADYRGMVRYRMLLAQGMVSPPYAVLTDRGVTGDGKTMRVGDREVHITGMPELNAGTRTWKPASR